MFNETGIILNLDEKKEKKKEDIWPSSYQKVKIYWELVKVVIWVVTDFLHAKE